MFTFSGIFYLIKYLLQMYLRIVNVLNHWSFFIMSLFVNLANLARSYKYKVKSTGQQGSNFGFQNDATLARPIMLSLSKIKPLFTVIRHIVFKQRRGDHIIKSWMTPQGCWLFQTEHDLIQFHVRPKINCSTTDLLHSYELDKLIHGLGSVVQRSLYLTNT